MSKSTKKDSSSSLAFLLLAKLTDMVALKPSTDNSRTQTSDHDEVDLKLARRIIRWAGIKARREDFLVSHSFTKWY